MSPVTRDRAVRHGRQEGATGHPATAADSSAISSAHEWSSILCKVRQPHQPLAPSWEPLGALGGGGLCTGGGGLCTVVEPLVVMDCALV